MNADSVGRTRTSAALRLRLPHRPRLSSAAAAITLVALPFSLIDAAVVMDRFGLTLDTMSLGRLAIATGELADDAIIDVENVVRRLLQNAIAMSIGRPAAKCTGADGLGDPVGLATSTALNMIVMLVLSARFDRPVS